MLARLTAEPFNGKFGPVTDTDTMISLFLLIHTGDGFHFIHNYRHFWFEQAALVADACSKKIGKKGVDGKV